MYNPMPHQVDVGRLGKQSFTTIPKIAKQVFQGFAARRDWNLGPLHLTVRVLDRDRGAFAVPLDLGLPKTPRRIVRQDLGQVKEADFLAAGSGIKHQDLHSSVRPSPVFYVRYVVAVLSHILLVLHQLGAKHLLEMGAYVP